MQLHLYNTLTKKKEPFTPIDSHNVRMYSCGPTVYNYIHIGNGRMAITFDMLQRLLTLIYGGESVSHVQNITDVDDKIIKTARDNDESIESLTSRFTQAYLADRAYLGCMELSHQPHCRDHIKSMVSMIETLIEKGHAYTSGADVFFSVKSAPAYGALSHRTLSEMLAGARVEVDERKLAPADFALWKGARPEEPAEVNFSSPWGHGRPGWHIECSAMAAEYLGTTFDIHGGGHDLIFPHHENEIAQSTCAHGSTAMANYWVHNGFLTVGNEKMSKSLGNFQYVTDMNGKWPGEVVRFALLSAHYRQPLSFTDDLLSQSYTTLRQWYTQAEKLAHGTVSQPDDKFTSSLLDDMNTPAAISRLHELAASSPEALVSSARLIGLLNANPIDFLEWLPETAPDKSWIASKISDRAEAKKSRDFSKADSIRNELLMAGLEVEDSPEGTRWKPTFS